MAGKITKRLEIATQTTGAAQTERELAKVGQAAAAAGAAAEKGMNKMTSSADDAGGRLDGLKSKLADSKEGFSALGASGFALTSALQSTSGSTTQLLGGLGAVTGAMSSIPGPIGVVSAGLTALIGVGTSVVSMLDTQVETTDDGAEAWARYAQTVNSAREQLGELADFASPARLRRIRELMGIRDSGSESLFSGDMGIPKLQAAVLRMEDELARRQAIAQAKGTVYNIDKVVAAQKQLDLLRENLGMAQKRASFAEDELAFASKQAAIETGRGKDEDARAAKRERAGQKKDAEGEGPYQDLGGMLRWIGTTQLNAIAGTFGDLISAGRDPSNPYIEGVDLLASAFSGLGQEIVGSANLAVSAYDDVQASMAATAAQSMEMGEALRNGAEAYASVAIGAAMAGESISAAVGAAMKAEALQYAAKAIGYAAEALFFSVWDPPAAAAAWAASAQAGAAAALFGAGAGVLGAGGGGGGGGASSAPVSSESLTGPRESSGGGGDIVINANFQGQPLLTDRAVAEAIGRGVSEANRQRGNPIFGRLS